MRCIEIKRVINGEFAVIMYDYRGDGESTLKEEKNYLNLERIESFKVGKTPIEREAYFERSQRYCEEKEEYIYEDNLPQESETFRKGYSYRWKLSIPEGTPEIRLYFSKYNCDLLFLNQDEYEKIYKALTEETI